MDKSDLVLLRKDLEAGHLHELIRRRLEEETGGPTVCPTCGTSVGPQEGFLLRFGPSDLRQQARFDAVDCIKYFLDNKPLE